MFALSIHFNSSLTILDHLGCECFPRYSSNLMTLLYLWCRSYDIFLSVSWLRTILLCGLAGLLKAISDFTYSLNPWVVWIVRCGWEMLWVILVRSRLIVHSTKSSDETVGRVPYYFLMHLIVYINAGLTSINSVSSMYTMTSTVLSSFNLYKRQGSVLHCLNPALSVIVLIYSLNQQCDSCTRL